MSRVSEQVRSTEQALEKPNIWWVVPILPLVITAGILARAKIEQNQQVPAPVSSAPMANTINAVGRLEPRGEVIKLSAPTSGLQMSSRVEEIVAKEGERVQKGQIIAILDNFTSNQAAVDEAKAKLEESRGNLANVKVGSPRNIQAQQAVIARLEAQLRAEKDATLATIARLQAQLRGETLAQKATVNRLQAELSGQQNTLRAAIARVRAEANNARVDARRYQELYANGAISQQERDRRQLSAETSTALLLEARANRTQAIASVQQQLAEARANQVKTIATVQQQIVEAKANQLKVITTLQKQIDEERAKLNRLQEVRPSDLQIASAQVSNAIALVRKAQAQLKLSYVKAPIAGEILKVYTKSGESISPNGIAEIGRTDQMIVIAEVPEDSIGQVRLGQQATITSDNGAFSGTIQGTVFEIGRKIGKKDVLNTDPAADIDARVVEVKIALPAQDSQKVSGLTYAKVAVEINI